MKREQEVQGKEGRAFYYSRPLRSKKGDFFMISAVILTYALLNSPGRNSGCCGCSLLVFKA